MNKSSAPPMDENERALTRPPRRESEMRFWALLLIYTMRPGFATWKESQLMRVFGR
jgi:hypothetical protein